ncbi:MAG: hypothetical protein U9O89_07635 [Thermoproteota archaeon]|nr:hypothetical protein [Thermoproteota archaeon]
MSTVIQEKNFVHGRKQEKRTLQEDRSVERLRDVILEEKKREASKPIYLVRYE